MREIVKLATADLVICSHPIIEEFVNKANKIKSGEEFSDESELIFKKGVVGKLKFTFVCSKQLEMADDLGIWLSIRTKEDYKHNNCDIAIFYTVSDDRAFSVKEIEKALYQKLLPFVEQVVLQIDIDSIMQ